MADEVESYLLTPPAELTSETFADFVTELNRILSRIGTERSMAVVRHRDNDVALWVDLPNTLLVKVAQLNLSPDSRWVVVAVGTFRQTTNDECLMELRDGDEAGTVVDSQTVEVHGTSHQLSTFALIGQVKSTTGRVTLTATATAGGAAAEIRDTHLFAFSLF